MLEITAALVIVIALNFYALMGGADYGGGVWDFFARGPRAERQRELIAEAIGPIWEANHVWLILVIVVLFTAFPPAFAVIGISLHVPVTLLLIGIVLRGSSFVFRAYGGAADIERRRWGAVFAGSSLITPVWLGVIVGAIASGNVADWMRWFPFAVGIFAVTLFAFLAAVYLTLETGQPELREDFRRRALVSAIAVGVMALAVFLFAGTGAPMIRARLGASPWTWPLQIATGIAAVGAFYGLWSRRWLMARACAVLQVSLILWGWALAQYPYLVIPSLTIVNVAAPRATLELLLAALVAGAMVLFPSFIYLLRVFKRRTI